MPIINLRLYGEETYPLVTVRIAGDISDAPKFTEVVLHVISSNSLADVLLEYIIFVVLPTPNTLLIVFKLLFVGVTVLVTVGVAVLVGVAV